METRQLVDWVTATRPSSIAAQLFKRYAPPAYPTEGLQDLGAPLPGANLWSTAPDGIPDVGTINATLSGPRKGDQFNGRFDQLLRSGKDRLRGTYYLSRSQSPFLYVRPQFNHQYPFRDQLLNVSHTTVLSNRTLQQLRREGLIGYKGGVLTMLNWDGLSECAEFDDSYLRLPGSGEEART